MKIYCLKSLFFAALIMLSFTACGGGYSKVQSAADLPSQKKTEKMNEALAIQAVNQQEDSLRRLPHRHRRSSRN